MDNEQFQSALMHWQQEFRDDQEMNSVFNLLEEFDYRTDAVLNYLVNKQQKGKFKGKVSSEVSKLVEKVKEEVTVSIRERICPIIAKNSTRKDLTVTLFSELLAIIQEHFGKEYSSPLITGLAIYMFHIGIDKFCI